MMKNAAGALALCLTAAVAQAQPAYRVKDVTPGPGGGSQPEQFTAAGGITYFVATDPGNGREIWRTDGTATGTRLLKDITPGPRSSLLTDLTEFGGALFFSANGSLCRSNGSTLGTTCLRPDLSQVGELTVHAARLYFVAYEDAHGRELWSTDGTPAGTVLVKDIGAAGAGPSEVVSLGGLLFFAAHGPGGRELWRSDGSEGGTLQVFDIRPGPGSSDPTGLTAVGSRLFFAADDGIHGHEPWSIDLDSSVTAMARDVEPGAESSFPEKATAFGGVAYFAAHTDAHGIELWRSDGTPAGTFLLKDMDPGFFSSFPGALTVFAGGLFFAAEDVNDYQLWRSDGTAAGTVPVNPAASIPFDLTVSGGWLFFSAEDTAHGRELWRSNGTSAGTIPLDLRPGPPSSHPWNFADVAGRLYFGAVPDGGASDFAHEPWTSDGGAGGTALLAPLGAGASTAITDWVELGGLFYFAASDGTHGFELWRSDGTEAGTSLVRDLVPGPDSSSPEDLTVVSGALYFRGTDERKHSVLWRSDGTAGGTVAVTAPGHPLSFVGAVTRAGSTVFLDGFDDVHGRELWKSDGTSAGTVLVRDLAPGYSVNGPEQMTDVNGILFFAGYDTAEGYSLWKSDGTEAGTVRVDIVQPGLASAFITSLTAVGGLLYFAADDGLHGPEPWVSDGTALGTRQVRDVQPGPVGSSADGFVGANGLAFFHADDGASGRELWRTDGSEAGTIRLGDIRPGPAGSSPGPRTRVGDVLLFGADDGVAGRELWRSDGTPAGTVRVRDIAPGADPSMTDTQAIVEWGGFAFFPAASGATGHELWRSDGTAAGTVLLQDVVPGPSSSGLVPMAAAGGRLFMQAADAAGRELWALRPEVTVANAAAAEGTHALVDVALVPRLDVPLAVPFTTVDNSAVGGSDFQEKSGVLTFVPGETLQTVDVTVLDDVTPEPVEQFFVDIAPGANAFSARPRGIVTVTDDDPAPVLTVDEPGVVEGDSGSVSLAFTVRLSAASATTVTVDYATLEGTAAAGVDFQATSGTLTFAPGVTARTVPVSVWGDVVDEPDEFFPLRLSLASGAIVGAGQGVGRIRDDDGVAIRLHGLDAGMDVTATLAGPEAAAAGDLYLVELAPFESYEVTVDAASGDLGDSGPIVEVLARDMTVVGSAVPSGVGHALSARMVGSSNQSMPTIQRYIRVRSAGCTTDCGADDTYRIRLRETTGRVARFNQTGGQRTVMILHNTTGEWIETEVHWRRADGTYAGANLFSLGPRRTIVFPAAETTRGASGSILVIHDGPLGAVVGKAVGLDEASGMSFDTPMTTRPR